jgi:hypothetical protein
MSNYTTINKSTDHFNTKLYTGNGSTNAQTGVGFQPDFTWLKARSESEYHFLYDAVRGATKGISSDLTSAEATYSDGLTAFASDGFTLGSSNGINRSGTTYASWNWKAGGGQGSSNTDGSINTTYTSANTTSGFSIVTYSGNATAGATVGHGLGVTPKMILIKNRNNSGWSWRVYHKSLGATKNLRLDTDVADATSSIEFNNTEPTSTVFSVGTSTGVNESSNNYLAYCFAEKTGYSKFGSYVGNNNSNGTFVYTGFKPAFIMMKSTAANENWTIYDNKRASFNPSTVRLHPNLNNAESSSTDLDLLSNGFKLRTTGGNSNDGTLIYMAFGQSLVGSNNVPCTAR